jgi:hypothetical protein
LAKKAQRKRPTLTVGDLETYLETAEASGGKGILSDEKKNRQTDRQTTIILLNWINRNLQQRKR